MASPSPNDLTRQQLDELDVLLQRMLALPVSSPEPAVAFPPPPPLPDLPPAAPRPAPRAMPEPPAVSWRADTPAGGKAPHLTPIPEPAVAFTPTMLPFPPSARSNPDPMPMPPPRPTPPVQEVPVPRLFAPPPSFNSPEPQSPVASPGTLRGVDAPALPFDFRRADPLPPPTPSDDFPEVNPFADPLPPVAEEQTATPPARPVPVYLWPVFALNWVLEFLLGWFGPVGQVLMRPLTKTLLGWLGVLLLVAAGVWAARGMGWVSWPQ